MKKEKTYLLDQIVESIDKDSAFAVLSYSSVSANDKAQMRTSLREAGGAMLVVKSRILKKYLESIDNEIQLSGHTAVVSAKTESFIGTAKVLSGFLKERKDGFKILGGRFEGAACDAATFNEIASLPTQQEIRAQIVGLLQTPQASVINIMNSALAGTVNCLDQKMKKS